MGVVIQTGICSRMAGIAGNDGCKRERQLAEAIIGGWHVPASKIASLPIQLGRCLRRPISVGSYRGSA